MLKEQTQTPVTVKSYDGLTDVNIKNMQESLRLTFPSFARKDIDDYGTPYLWSCCYETHECGCKIEGNRTLQFPLRINFCAKHNH